MRRRVAIAALGLAALSATGCYVLDELDSANGAMEKSTVSGVSRKPAAGAPAAQPDDEKPQSEESGGWLATLKGLFEPDPKKPRRRPRDPDDPIVRCEVGSRLLFTGRKDCEAQRGKVLEEKRAAR
jgi:hypothetical protein